MRLTVVWWERWRDRLIRGSLRRVPLWVAESPERVVINVAVSLVGCATLASEPRRGSVWSGWPSWLQPAWSFAMVVGGLSILCGLYLADRWRYALSLERSGYVLLLPACLLFGVMLLVRASWPIGLMYGSIFLGIAAAKALRLLVTTAARAAVLRQADREGNE